MSQQFKIKDFKNSANILQQLTTKNLKKLDKLLSLKRKTYKNFMVPYQLLDDRLNKFLTPIFHLDSVENSELTQKVYTQCLPIISKYTTEIGQNEKLFQAIKEIKKNEYKKLTQEQKKVLDNEIRDFALSGCGATKKDKKRLEKIDLKLNMLSQQFSQNLLDATNNWEIICDEKDVKQIPQTDKENAKFIDKDGTTKYKFTLQMPSYIAYITYGNNRKKREQIYKAYSSRAPQNSKIITKLLKLKDKKAKILGFANYAQYSLATKMAENENDVISFLEYLATKSKPKAKKELQEIEKLAKSTSKISKLQAYDIAYFSEKLKQKQYNIDQEYYRNYFEQNMVLDGFFKFLNKLFGIKFIQTKEKSWNKKVKIFHIYQQKKYIGKIFLDLEARKTKRGGAWMNNWHDRYKLGKLSQTPSAFVVCNFPPSTKKQPSLLRHSDVVTLFHEMGHALHHLLTTVDQPFVSGINGVAWDTVEFPSQFLEYFAYEKEVLQLFAKHYKTGKTLSKKDIKKLIKAKNFQTALGTIRQVEFALFDFKLHQKPQNEKGVQLLLDNIRKKYGVVIPPKYNKFQNGFAHIFAGGYSAGYYSYKWAEVLSADAFYIFLKHGIFNKTVGKKYKDIILGKGGSKDMNRLYFEFASHKPSVESLLKIDNIIS